MKEKERWLSVELCKGDHDGSYSVQLSLELTGDDAALESAFAECARVLAGHERYIGNVAAAKEFHPRSKAPSPQNCTHGGPRGLCPECSGMG